MDTPLHMHLSRDVVLSTERMLVLYTCTSSLPITYNAGAMAGVMYGAQVLSGVLMCMLYSADEHTAYALLDSGCPLWSTHGSLCCALTPVRYLSRDDA
jgi:hypothetical protein